MSGLLKNMITLFLISWCVLITVVCFKDGGLMDMKTTLFGSFIYAIFIGPMAALVIHCAKYKIHVDIKSNRPVDTGLVSCKKCGYLGAGAGGFCSRCGWNWVEKITSDTTMISCPKCGFLGAGVRGFCTRCGSNRAVKISK